MKENFSEVVFSVPYEMAAVRPLRQTSRQERQAALQAACYNTELIPQELVYVDLKTDSGVSAFSTRQVATLLGAGSLESGMDISIIPRQPGRQSTPRDGSTPAIAA